jgi:release factor glutamine methyltransferase
LTPPSRADLLYDAVARLRAAGCVFAEEEAELLLGEARHPEQLADMVARRATGVPIEVIVGWAEFCDLRIEVDPGVFVPRQRTAFLVQRAVALAHPGALVVDLCCGTGAIGVALATAVPGTDLHAADIDAAAVRCARRNVATVSGHTYLGDLFDALPARLRGRVDLLLVNAPYVPTDEIELMPPEARDHEPRIALDGGAGGVDVHRRVAAEAPEWLRPGGHLLVETSEQQAELTAQAMREAGLRVRVDVSDEMYSTVVTGTR